MSRKRKKKAPEIVMRDRLRQLYRAVDLFSVSQDDRGERDRKPLEESNLIMTKSQEEI